MQIKNQTILAIAPHFDDIELGCFGTLHKLSAENTIYYMGLSFPSNTDKDTFIKNSIYPSLDQLSIPHNNLIIKDYNPRNFADSRTRILQDFYDINKKVSPDIIFIPNSQDVHQSHQVTHQEAVRIFKNNTILGYELPWNNFNFNAAVFMKLSQTDLDAKIKAISYFPSHGKQSFFENGITQDLANLRGKQINLQYAESFELVRMICK